MKHAIKHPGDELREKRRSVGAPPKRTPRKKQQIGEEPDELGIKRGQNAEKGNPEDAENLRTDVEH